MNHFKKTKLVRQCSIVTMNTPDLETFGKARNLKANKCNQCDYAFVKADNLKKHLKKTLWRENAQMQ